ncbi:MAG: NAD(P)H-dependent glycerol-3-phosphate dehydrogenase [Rhodothermales bacterium]|nr:NAD(P)H-dependent glycerol-3-phosphate dehydrogenase [Rhodothermales bacterium]
MSKRIAVIGAGSFGTALSISLASSGHKVSLWARREEAAEFMRRERHNETYLPDVKIPENVIVTSDLFSAARDADIWLFATPSHAVRPVAESLRDLVHPELLIVSVAKGIENETLLTTSQVVQDVYPDFDPDRIAVLYGPSHAEEVGTGTPTAVVVASSSSTTASILQDTFMTPRLRVYANNDVIGVEIAGSVKNILAIAAGMSEGVGYGDNAKAALITRGIAEIRRFGVAMGANPQTFSGLAGIGDLVVTCMSKHSRNRFLGEEIGKGKSLEQVQNEMQMVAEGVRTTRSVHDLALRIGVDMPITAAVYAILFEGKKPEEAVKDLMERSAKTEEWLHEPQDTVR